MYEIAIFGMVVGLVFAVMAWLFYDSERRWRQKMKERWSARDRAREESLIWFKARLAQIRAREQQQTDAALQTRLELHTPARRRFLPLHEHKNELQ